MEESNSSLLPPKTGMETMKAKSGNLTGDFKVTNAIPRLRVPPVVNHFDGTNFGLPEGWTVKQKSKTSPKYFGTKDKVSSIIKKTEKKNYIYFVSNLKINLIVFDLQHGR